ncbi:GGDEF domain-containing protein [Mycolicibacterium sp. CH28]|nr:GGDEF domain-containing protein [Mycolicibacterium sp. CH28]
MLLFYCLFCAGVYCLGLIAWVRDREQTDFRGELVAAGLSAVGVLLCVTPPLRGWRYVSGLACVSAAPVAALFFHHNLAAQVWALIPLMFLAIFVRTWHRPMVTRIYVVVVGLAAAVGLLMAPQPAPPLWPLLFLLSIGGAAEVFGLSHAILRNTADRDPLTGVWNRAGFDRHADALIAQSYRKGQPLAVLLVDVDDFKLVNDRDGHAAGDDVLISLTKRWAEQLPDSAVMGRLGGDEFVVLLMGQDEAGARAMAQALSDTGPVPVTLGVSVGRPSGAADFTALLAAADADLYARKRERKSRSANAE